MKDSRRATMNIGPVPRPGAARRLGRALLAMSGLAVATGAWGVDLDWSGFYNVTAGRVFSSDDFDPLYPGYNSRCPPCYIADYARGSVYTNRWDLTPESRAGLQGVAQFTPAFSFTGQLVARTLSQQQKLSAEWAYFSYELSPHFTLQAGRKRLPLFLYTDSQDVTFASNWVRLPAGFYGWAVTNYNGVNLTYRDEFGGWSVKSNAYAGSEHVKDAPLAHFGSAARQDVRWSAMRGIDLELSRGWFSTRLAIDLSNSQTTEPQQNGGSVIVYPDADYQRLYGRTTTPQRYVSWAVAIDKDNWVVRSEVAKLKRSPARPDFKGFFLGAGYRIGNVLPMVTYGAEFYYDKDSRRLTERDQNVSYTLHYQVNENSAVKAQVDVLKWRYPSDGEYVSVRRRLFSLSYERVF